MTLHRRQGRSALRGNHGPRYHHRVEAAAPYDTSHGAPLTPIIGADIAGVDVSQPLGTPQREELQRALAAHLVLLVDGNQLCEIGPHR